MSQEMYRIAGMCAQQINNDLIMGIRDRDVSLDVFRCLLMFLIVLYHAFCNGLWPEGEFWWSAMACNLLCWHVNSFVAISGWFGVRFSMKKYLKLYGQILFYSVLSCIYLLLNGDRWQLRVGGGWFGGTYLMLLMIAPLLNALIEKLCEKKDKEIFLAWAGAAAAIILEWFPRNLFSAVSPAGIDKGYSIVMFVFIYLTVRLMKVKRIALSDLEMFLGIFIYCAVVVGLNLFAWYSKQLGFERTDYTTYNAPHVVIMSITALYFAMKHFRPPRWFGRLAVYLAPSMFGVYLLHDVAAFGHLLYRIPQTFLQNHTAIHPIIEIVLSAVVAFVVAGLVDVARRKLFQWGAALVVVFYNKIKCRGLRFH